MSIPILPPDDHRALVRRLDLCHFQDEAPGMAFWHARGWTLYRLLEDAARAQVLAGGYREVNTPQLLRRPVWQTSGHWDAFAGGMFAFGAGDDEAALKPVSCPGHIQLVKRMAPSWRDLPLRLAEFGRVHRDEPTGTLHGLMRLRQFCQDDGHIFCTDDQIHDEVARFCRELPAFYARFGFTDIAVALSLRPDERIGDDAAWDRAEQILGDVAASLGVPVEIQPGAGAIYGPKLEFALRDRRGRVWQCGTIQLDFAMPRRFDVRYVDAGGERKPVAMLHRALFGSIERFLGVLLEHHGAGLPAWLAPEQVAIVPIAERHREYAERVRAALGVRARIDVDDTLARRVAIAHHDGVPLVAIVGDRDVASEAISIRDRDAQLTLPFDAAIARLRERCAS
ncbi:MAG TPA: threonine--tRNA ligase [Kofleriaceae bacterium]|jgi:threonyl-tRNA synthetase